MGRWADLALEALALLAVLLHSHLLLVVLLVHYFAVRQRLQPDEFADDAK